MKNYRFKPQEIEQVKNSILTHIQYEENGEKTAWRYRLALSAQSQCSRTKKTRDRYTRLMALYEQLTTKDLPNWLPTDQTPDRVQVITELAKKTFANDFAPKMSTKEVNTYAWMGAPVSINDNTHEIVINIKRKTNANKINAFLTKINKMGIYRAWHSREYGEITIIAA